MDVNPVSSSLADLSFSVLSCPLSTSHLFVASSKVTGAVAAKAHPLSETGSPPRKPLTRELRLCARQTLCRPLQCRSQGWLLAICSKLLHAQSPKRAAYLRGGPVGVLLLQPGQTQASRL